MNEEESDLTDYYEVEVWSTDGESVWLGLEKISSNVLLRAGIEDAYAYFDEERLNVLITELTRYKNVFKQLRESGE